MVFTSANEDLRVFSKIFGYSHYQTLMAEF